MGPDTGAVHEVDLPLYLPGSIGLPLDLSQEPVPQSPLAPPVKPAGHRTARAISLRQSHQGALTGVGKNGIIATNRPRHPWIPAYAGMTEWA